MDPEPTVLNPIVIDAITTIVTAFLTVTLVALLPFLQARRKAKQEEVEASAKSGVFGAEALEKMTGAFSDIQDFYITALGASNAKVLLLESEVAALKSFGGKIKQIEEMTEQIVVLTDKVLGLKRDLRIARLREAKLKEMAEVLIAQLRRLDEEPEISLADLYED